MSNFPLVSVVLTTKNEEKNVANCLQSIKNQTYPQTKIEIIVVDNYSPDKTIDIAEKFTENIYYKGPHRAAQLNFGVQKARGKYIFYPDADMILSENVMAECVDKCENEGYISLYIPENIIGSGFWISVRDFERSFYNGTCIDAVRFVRRETFLETGGFDESIDFGPDDWDFNKRIKEIGKMGIITAQLYHNEGEFNVNKYLGKKNHYVKTLTKYIEKWGKNDLDIRKQLGIQYRLFGVFLEKGKWKKLVRHPLLTIAMYFLRLRVAIGYLGNAA